MKKDADIFQDRYLEHIARKKRMLEQDATEWVNGQYDVAEFIEILKNRRSQRVFNSIPLDNHQIDVLLTSVVESPSSCNRQAISIKIVSNPSLLGDLLVGGVGWARKANILFLLFADQKAYKALGEKEFMPYLDAGFVGQSVCLTAEALGVGSCFINPNIRTENKDAFNNLFNKEGLVFCGAVALGNYDRKSKRPPKRECVLIEW